MPGGVRLVSSEGDIPTVRLSAAKRRHIVSAYATVCGMLRQMEEAAGEGRSPTGMGAPLSPLPAEQAEAVLAPLRDLKGRLRQIAAELAPDELAEFERPQHPNNTWVWLSNLADRIRVSVDDLQPARVRKYGKLAHDEEALLQAVHRDLSRFVTAARDGLDAALGPTDGRP